MRFRNRFTATASLQETDPNAELYRAVLLPETVETIVTTDGERVEDVNHTNTPTEVWVEPDGEYRVVVGDAPDQSTKR